MRFGRFVLLFVLLSGVLVSALAVVNSKYQSRQLFLQLQGLRGEKDHIEVEWGRLQLELQTWATNSRIDKLAREQLGMKLPDATNTVLIGLSDGSR